MRIWAGSAEIRIVPDPGVSQMVSEPQVSGSARVGEKERRGVEGFLAARWDLGTSAR